MEYLYYDWTHMFSISVNYSRLSKVSSFSFTCSRNMRRERDSCTICENTNTVVLILSYSFVQNSFLCMLLIWCAYCEYSLIFCNLCHKHGRICYLCASWNSILTYFIFLPHTQTQLLAVLLHLTQVPVSNVCWRLLNFLGYQKQILI